jgi:hypothetical protein
MNKTRKLMIIVASLVVATTLVSAGALEYFGKVHTTINVQQSIVIGDGTSWFNWNQPVARDIGNASHCTDYCYKLLLKNQACVDANVRFIEDPRPENLTINHYVFGDTQTVHLQQKVVVWGSSPWALLQDGAWADVTFNTCGKTFNYTITYSGLNQGTEYALIYYANYPEYWTAAPVRIIDTFIAGGGNVSDSVNIPTMPTAEDENALRPISIVGEIYNHTYGAKLWIVPLVDIENGDLTWGQATSYLWETDLAFYLDCDAWRQPELYCLPNVFPLFDTTVLKAKQTYCWISCYHLDFYSSGGKQEWDTFVHASPVTQVVQA